MDNIVVTAACEVTEADVRAARLGQRFARLDLMSQLALLAVESLSLNLDAQRRDRIGICLAARTGSLSTDAEYWQGRDASGGPSPTLFAYTLPSAAIGEIAIRHRLTGPNLCLVGEATGALAEAVQLICHGEAEACLCVECNVVTPAVAQILQMPPAAQACALFIQRSGGGLHETHLNTTTEDFLPLPARNEWGEGRGEGHSNKDGLLSPAFSSVPEEREKSLLRTSMAARLHAWRENDRDIESLCALLCSPKSAT